MAARTTSFREPHSRRGGARGIQHAPAPVLPEQREPRLAQPWMALTWIALGLTYAAAVCGLLRLILRA